LLMPVAAEVPVVTPVIAQVNKVTAQLSATVGLAVATEAVQVPAPTFAVTFAGHVIVGRMLSVIVTVKKHVAELPAASNTV
jgi:hypothetical protein